MNKITVGISGAIILLLLSGAVVSFSQNNQSINHPYKVFFERRISQFSTFPVSRDSIVFLGDSLIDEGRWEEMFPNAKTVNRGVLADRTEHIIARLDQDFCDISPTNKDDRVTVFADLLISLACDNGCRD